MSIDDFGWLEDNQDITHVSIGICDLNGVVRGKRIPVEQAKKVLEGGLKFPLSVATIDVWGEDLFGNEYTLKNGDQDGICQYTGRGVLPVDWLSSPSAFIPVSLLGEDGKPFEAESRYALSLLVDKFNARGLRPVVAAELEFFLYDLSSDEPAAIPSAISSPISGRLFDTTDLMSVDHLDHLDLFLSDLHEACEKQGIAADTMGSENAPSQYEVNLLHVDDPVRAADDTVLFKRLIRGVARKHGFGATFMAKPYGDQAGNSMHVHFSLIDSDGNNVFNDGTDEGSDILRHAVGGLLHRLSESTLAFAPHFNSYKRLRPGLLAPINVTWAYENRTGAIRIPNSGPQARRIEHRVAGADANPYLVLAAILGAALEGIDEKRDPGKPIDGWGYTENPESESIPSDWGEAIDLFEKSDFAQSIFPEMLHTLLIGMKKYELNKFTEKITEFEYKSYLETV
ncbi:MAG: glutamine synthetase [Rhodospirillales bacterium]|nr:glutamine synthetase [Rhodospirillales bacterium]